MSEELTKQVHMGKEGAGDAKDSVTDISRLPNRSRKVHLWVSWICPL